MLIVLMYHRVTNTGILTKDNAFARHLTWLAENYPIVVPGDPLIKNRVNVCITFDDAYFDFYHTVFPLLQNLQIPAVLAVPAGLILDDTKVSAETRLAVPYRDALHCHQSHASLCTWQEIRTMAATKLVIPASHSLTHQQVIRPDFEQEVVYAKQLIEEKANTAVDTFIYPFGKMNLRLNALIRQYYRYTMRIGSSLNVSWKNCHNVVYRINAEEFWPQEKPMFDLKHRGYLALRFLSNTLRCK